MYSANDENALARAWAYHRNGQNKEAVVEFQKMIQQHPHDVDANFGLGLAQRALGQHETAISTFEKTEQLVAEALAKEPGEDRWEMLTRMCQQRIAEIRLAMGA